MNKAAADNKSDPNLKPLIIAYLVHLLVPLFFLLDVVFAWRFPPGAEPLAAPVSWWAAFGPVGQLVFLSSAVWLALGLLLLAAVQRLRPSLWGKLQGPLIAFYATVLTLIVMELGLNVIQLGEQEPALWAPGQEVLALLKPDPKLMPGVEDAARFTGNDVGLRGADFPSDSDNVYKIVTIGGSTTEVLYLDDTEDWSYLLMSDLNARSSGVPVWVANGGQSGRNTVDHLELMRVLPVLNQVELLVFLIGINDLQPTLSVGGGPTQEILAANTIDFRKQVLNGGRRVRPSRPYFKRTELFKLVRRTSAELLGKFSPTTVSGWLGVGPGGFITEKRQQRAIAPSVELPDLRIGLEEYRLRVRAIAAECQGRGVRCLFLTQPTIWRHDLSPRNRDLLWFGWVRNESQPTGYLSPGDLAIAMDAFNGTLLSVCAEDGLECFDLAPLIAKDTSAFYDDAHFNENGARTVAGLLADYLASRDPFVENAR